MRINTPAIPTTPSTPQPPLPQPNHPLSHPKNPFYTPTILYHTPTTPTKPQPASTTAELPPTTPKPPPTPPASASDSCFPFFGEESRCEMKGVIPRQGLCFPHDFSLFFLSSAAVREKGKSDHECDNNHEDNNNSSDNREAKTTTMKTTTTAIIKAWRDIKDKKTSTSRNLKIEHRGLTIRTLHPSGCHVHFHCR